jgi:chemotaxis protein methyltransferase CheR
VDVLFESVRWPDTDTMISMTKHQCTRLRDLVGGYSGLGEVLLTDGVLERAVEIRLAALGIQDITAYWPLLQSHSKEEMNCLVQLLTNKETFFFREMHQFEVLHERVLPDLLAARKFAAKPDYAPGSLRIGRRQPLRLWSAGCATGEEAYSLAITLLEFQKRHGGLDAQVIASDIDDDALEVARRGRYGERAVRLVPEELRRRYFTTDGHAYDVVPEVSRLVSFQVHNLAEKRRPPGLSGLDVIFCRNVAVYFSEKARDQLNACLADALHEGGYLFVASAETLGHNRGRLELFAVGSTFLFRKRPRAPQPLLSSSALAPPIAHPNPTKKSEAAHPPVAPRPRSPQLFRQAREEPRKRPLDASSSEQPGPSAGVDEGSLVYGLPLKQARLAFRRQAYDDALRDLDRLLSEQPPVLEAHSLRAAILVQQERLGEAENTCQFLLAHDPWHVDAHFLMGLIAHHQGQAGAAIQALKTTVYLQPEHRWAHYYLAEIYHALGMEDRARREYKNTLNVLRLARRPPGLSEFDLSGLDDSVLRQTCEVNLQNLHGQEATERGSGTGRA